MSKVKKLVKKDNRIKFGKDCMKFLKKWITFKEGVFVQSLKIEIDSPVDIPKITISTDIL